MIGVEPKGEDNMGYQNEDKRIWYPPDDDSPEWIERHAEDNVFEFLDCYGLIEAFDAYCVENGLDKDSRKVALKWVDENHAEGFQDWMQDLWWDSKEPPERLGDHE